MGVYIKGMEMPKRGHTITITIVGSGQAYVEYFDCRPHAEETIEYTAVPVAAHGRLIDKDALEADISASVVFSGRDGNAEIVGAKKIINRLHVAPTVIEAEEGE